MVDEDLPADTNSPVSHQARGAFAPTSSRTPRHPDPADTCQRAVPSLKFTGT